MWWSSKYRAVRDIKNVDGREAVNKAAKLFSAAHCQLAKGTPLWASTYAGYIVCGVREAEGDQIGAAFHYLKCENRHLFKMKVPDRWK